MKLSIKAIAITSALLWGGSILLVGICNRFWPSYGTTFLSLVDSIYPGYHAGSGLRNLIIGTLYGLLDGFVGGAIFGFIYNLFVPKQS